MSSREISDLKPEEVEEVARLLRGLVDSLRAKKAAAGGTLIPDEDTVFTALTHPERGDAVISVIHTPGELQVFISNRRDLTSPFAVMDCGDLRKHPDRRMVDGSRPDPKPGKIGLFLASVRDEEVFRQSAKTKIESYSAHFHLFEPIAVKPISDAVADLKTKPLAACTTAEKWTIYKRDWDYDQRREAIEKELFSFPVTFARHKAGKKEEVIILAPGKHSSNIGQLIRDIYPVGVRASLRRDYPAEHRAKLDEVHAVLSELSHKIRGHMAEGNGEEYNAFLDELSAYINEILTVDPELTRV